MKVQTTHTWDYNGIGKVPTFFEIRDTVEFGCSFRRVKFLNRNLSSINELESIDPYLYSNLYFITISLFIFKFIIKLNNPSKV